MKTTDLYWESSISVGRKAGVAVLLLSIAACSPLSGVAKPEEVPPAPPATPPVVSAPPGALFLGKGLRAYDDGSYDEAAVQFRNALELGLSPQDQVSARKHLAFTYCVSGRQGLCADEFRKVFELMPSFDLVAAELGHPLWGPVFKRVKASRKADLRK